MKIVKKQSFGFFYFLVAIGWVNGCMVALHNYIVWGLSVSHVMDLSDHSETLINSMDLVVIKPDQMVFMAYF